MVKIIGIRVKEIREYRRIKGKELAWRAGISAAEVSHIESGNREPGIDIIERLAATLDVTLDYLAGKEDADVPLPRGLARQSLRLFLREANLTAEQEQYLQKVAGTEAAPLTVEGWAHLLRNVTLWDAMR